jgi:hypothetical protein
VPISVATIYTRTVSVGDVFDIAYGVNSGTSIGWIDLRNTATLSFDLPEGVYLTSALGATFGNVPEPSPALLLASSALPGLGAVCRRRIRRG